MIITLNKKNNVDSINDIKEFKIGRSKDDKNTIVVMEIDTDNKSKIELENEVISRVDEAIDKSLEQYKLILTESEFNSIQREMIAERNRMIKSFIFQIRNLEEIKTESERDWTTSEIEDMFSAV